MTELTDLFSDAGQAALKQFAQPGMLCLFDFDGTLAPLVADPVKAMVPHKIQQRLMQLQAITQVGIVTGRSLADIYARLEFVPDYLVGNHGVEGLPGWQQHADEFYAICRSWHTKLAPEIAAMDKGIQLEDKRYSLSLHFRQAQDHAAVIKILPPLFTELSPSPRVISGKCVFNLLPRHAADKGYAVSQLIEQAGAQRTLYVGDDVTDEDVFSMRRDDVFSVRVGCDEGPVTTAALYCITTVASIEFFLDQLVDILSTDKFQPAHFNQANQR
jgi:trehalose 6-phosphate phosphatase